MDNIIKFSGTSCLGLPCVLLYTNIFSGEAEVALSAEESEFLSKVAEYQKPCVVTVKIDENTICSFLSVFIREEGEASLVAIYHNSFIQLVEIAENEWVAKVNTK